MPEPIRENIGAFSDPSDWNFDEIEMVNSSDVRESCEILEFSMAEALNLHARKSCERGAAVVMEELRRSSYVCISPDGKTLMLYFGDDMAGVLSFSIAEIIEEAKAEGVSVTVRPNRFG